MTVKIENKKTSKSKHQTSKQSQNLNFKINSKCKYYKIRESYKIYDIRERLLMFSKRVLEICKMIPITPEGNKIRSQLGSSGMSIGANFEEADGALTRKDFVNKVGIARKEAKETKYWLKVIGGVYVSNEKIYRDIRESEEIINILSSMIKKSGFVKRR